MQRNVALRPQISPPVGMNIALTSLKLLLYSYLCTLLTDRVFH